MSLSLSLPPPALTFLKWLEITQGRDKLYRLVQYGSKFIIQQLKDHGGEKDTIDRLSKGASAVGMTRKLMRFFRSMEYTQEFLKSINVKDEFERYVSMLKAFSLFVWMVADHIQWMNKAGYLKLGTTPKIDEIHSKSWLYGLFFGVVLNVYKLRALIEEQKSKSAELRNHEAGGRQKEADEAAKKIIELDDKKNKQVMGIVKNGLDMFIPIQRLQWLPITDGTAGLAGAITSVIGIRDTWPASTPSAAKTK